MLYDGTLTLRVWTGLALNLMEVSTSPKAPVYLPGLLVKTSLYFQLTSWNLFLISGERTLSGSTLMSSRLGGEGSLAKGVYLKLSNVLRCTARTLSSASTVEVGLMSATWEYFRMLTGKGEMFSSEIVDPASIILGLKTPANSLLGVIRRFWFLSASGIWMMRLSSGKMV